MNIFGGWGYDETVDIFRREGIAKFDYFLELFLNILGPFLKVKIQNWNIFVVLLSIILGGMPDTSDIFER